LTSLAEVKANAVLEGLDVMLEDGNGKAGAYGKDDIDYIAEDDMGAPGMPLCAAFAESVADLRRKVGTEWTDLPRRPSSRSSH